MIHSRSYQPDDLVVDVDNNRFGDVGKVKLFDGKSPFVTSKDYKVLALLYFYDIHTTAAGA